MSGDGSIWRQLLPEEKVRAVKKMAREDMTARQIADVLQTKPAHVRTLAAKHDILLMHHVSPDKLPVVWEQTEDMTDTAYARRYAAWQRAVEGAKETLKSTGKSSVENSATLGFSATEVDDASSGSGRFVLANKPATTIEAQEPCRAPAYINASDRTAA